MRKILMLLVILLVSACRQSEEGKELMLTVAPPSESVLPDLEVINVTLRWSQVWECGVDIHITIANHSPTTVDEFTLSLHDRRESVIGIAGASQRTVIVSVSGEQMASWMDTSGTVDADNVIAESDETNNDYRHPLPYSAVPGMESIAICNMTKNAPTPSHTITASRMNPINTLSPTPTHTPTKRPYPGNEAFVPPDLPNLRVVSMRNSFVPTTCWIDGGAGNRHVVWIDIINDGRIPIDAYTIRFNGIDTEYVRLSAGETRHFEFIYDYSGEMQVELDPFNEVAEINEDDNMRDMLPMTFTPPPHCTKTPTMSPT